jgi:hypothetical protein
MKQKAIKEKLVSRPTKGSAEAKAWGAAMALARKTGK